MHQLSYWTTYICNFVFKLYIYANFPLDVKSRVVTTFSRLSRLEQKFLTNKSRDDPHLAIALGKSYM